MMRHCELSELRCVAVTLVMLGLSGCGTIYRSADVVEGVSDGTNVRVLTMTSETIVQANRSPYAPQTLPAVFSQTSGAGAAPRRSAALPEPPLNSKTRPRSLELRLPPKTDPGPYRIGVGDVVSLSMRSTGTALGIPADTAQAKNLRQGFTVQDDRSVNIPSIGRVRIAELTVEDAEARLFQRFVENQIDPSFSLDIAAFNARKVSIGGAVGLPAVVPVTLTPLYLDEALAAAGGITVEDQDYASIRLYRAGTLYQIPLTELYSRAGLTRTRLVPGDAVFVDTEYELSQAQDFFEQQITLLQARQGARAAALDELETEVSLRRANLSEARENYTARVELGADNREYVYLTGEVGKQSRFALPFERTATLADALFDAGGFASVTGDISQIYVLRASDDPREFGAVTAWHLDARNAAKFSLATGFELRPNDIVFIAQQPVTRWDRAVSQIFPQVIRTGTLVAGN